MDQRVERALPDLRPIVGRENHRPTLTWSGSPASSLMASGSPVKPHAGGQRIEETTQTFLIIIRDGYRQLGIRLVFDTPNRSLQLS